ncbi:hypothetical protein PW52_12010 [Tamlana sedimentorum]|uniref:Uncharacterized protein n=1 Tax=Neotamlana sedimentorum TaxID=1435349 RepID=A0A0D7W7S1_9FLAO|nr:hypothetical protein [Tamlana sedimentorum]KJD35074.1 hypothetical protein PW52_12010 [Tamlana sedimentorum]
MKINWNSTSSFSDEVLSTKLKMEYEFRKRVMKFIIENNIPECCEDYSCVVFDFFVDENCFKISKETHEPLYSNFIALNKTFKLDETG